MIHDERSILKVCKKMGPPQRRCLTVVAVLSAACVIASMVTSRSLIQIATESTNTKSESGVRGSYSGTSRSKFLDLWDEYVSQHSDQALRDEFGQNGKLLGQSQRKFAIGYYSCPLQAGNRMHHFTNSVLWAVLTNRTLLWKYYDKETCQEVGHGFDRMICFSANTEPDCAEVLERADFLPSYDYWASKLDLPSPEFLPYWSTGMPLTHVKYWYEGVENDIIPGVADSTNATLVAYAQMFHQTASSLLASESRNLLLITSAARERANRLLTESIDFIYGFIFFACFSFNPSISVPPQFPKAYKENEGTAVVMHSRHDDPKEDGSNILRETLCLQKVLSETQGSCQVSLMSDRPETIEGVRLFLGETFPHCTVLVAPHDVGKSWRKEHGPFAGTGYFQDLALVWNQTSYVHTATTAFVGSNERSSGEIVREAMAYQLHQRKNDLHSVGELVTCYYEDVLNQSL